MMTHNSTKRYRRPLHHGGTIIRKVIRLLREYGVKLPLQGQVVIACSGGPDSVALAHLMIHYGRRITSKEQIQILHVNHGWRGKDSDSDERWVQKRAQEWGVSFRSERHLPPRSGTGESWELIARNQRKKAFNFTIQALETKNKHAAWILTAHHLDDLAETVLWRVLTGAAETHGGGIAVQKGRELRPFLSVRKKELHEYLKEEGLKFRLDRTNDDPRFLRARMRKQLMPVVIDLFPRAVEHLAALGLRAQKSENARAPSQRDEGAPLAALLSASGLRLRREHWKTLERLHNDENHEKILTLPKGWILRQESGRWVLEAKKPN